MQRLIKYINLEQQDIYQFPDWDERTCTSFFEELVNNVQRAYRDQFIKEPDHSKSGAYRASMIGAPIWIGIWNKFHPVQNSMTNQNKYKTVQGLLFEEDLYLLLLRLGYEKIERQMFVEHKVADDVLVTGHPDFIVEDDDGTMWLLECKEVDSKRYKQMLKDGPGFQYLMQLSLYAQALNITHGMWIIRNRDTKELAYIPFDLDITAYAKMLTYLVALHELESFDEAFGVFPAPKPAKLGVHYYVPYTYYVQKGVLHPVVQKIFTLGTNDNGKPIITGYNFPDKYKEYEPDF